MALPLVILRAEFVGLIRRARELERSRSGIAAVEFALVLPLMLVLFFGLAETTTAVTVDRKLTLLSRSLADLSSRESEVLTADMQTIFSASSAIMRPYDATQAQMVVSSVLVTQQGQNFTGKIDWSCGKNIPGTSNPKNLVVRPTASAYPVPDGFQSSNTKSFIVVETVYPYTSVFQQTMIGTKYLSETTPWPVRNNDKVKGPASC